MIFNLIYFIQNKYSVRIYTVLRKVKNIYFFNIVVQCLVLVEQILGRSRNSGWLYRKGVEEGVSIMGEFKATLALEREPFPVLPTHFLLQGFLYWIFVVIFRGAIKFHPRETGLAPLGTIRVATCSGFNWNFNESFSEISRHCRKLHPPPSSLFNSPLRRQSGLPL